MTEEFWQNWKRGKDASQTNEIWNSLAK